MAAEEETECHTGPFGEAALVVAAPAMGEAALDVGCGCGSTAVALAAALGAGGRVLGVDLSDAMLARAEERPRPRGSAKMTFRRVDAQTADLTAGGFDLVFSRFGVMFFADPVAGFANLRRALRPGGRMVFACWQTPSANPWMGVVNRAAARIFNLDAPPHDAPGPFSLADPARIASILDGAGFRAVEITSHQRTLRLGLGRRVEDWVHQRLLMGPARSLYLAADPSRQGQIRATVVAALTPYQLDANGPLGGLSMDAAAWIVTARP